MGNDPPKIDQRPHRHLPLDRADHHHHKLDADRLRIPLRDILREKPELLDRYTPKLLNHVIRNLKSLVTHKPDRAFDLAARRDAATQREALPRGDAGKARGAGPETAKEGLLVMKGGKMVPADPETLQKMEKLEALEKMAAALKPGDLKNLMGKAEGNLSPELKEALSLFEKVFMARFEGGASLEEGAKLQPGQAKFMQKSEKSWAEFFQKFIPFTLTKKVPLADVEALVYRGLVTTTSKGNVKGAAAAEPKGELISDLKLASGKTDKFARLEIQGNKVLEELASKMPGDVLATALIAEWVGGPDLAYQALSHKIVNPDMAKNDPNPAVESYQSPEASKEAAIREGVREARPGIALDARTEELVARHLDIELKPGRTDLASDRRTEEERAVPGAVKKGDGPWSSLFKKKKKGLLASMMTWEESVEEGVFVPWYQHVFKRKKFPGKVRWWMPLLYFTAFSATGLLLVYIFKFMLQR